MNDSNRNGEIGGLKQSQTILIGAIGVVGAVLAATVFYQATRVDALSARIDFVVGNQGQMLADIAVLNTKMTRIESDLGDLRDYLLPARAPIEPPQKQ